MTYLSHIATLAGIFVLLTTSLNLIFGVAGITTLGHVAVYGVGAYIYAITTLTYHISTPIALCCSGITAGCIGGIFALCTKKMNSDQLMISSIGVVFLAYTLFQQWISLTNGPMGISGIPRPLFTQHPPHQQLFFFIYSTSIVSICTLFIFRLAQSRYGRLLEAIRDDIHGAQALGKPAYTMRVQVCSIGSFFAGIAGALFAQHVQYIDPSSFYLSDIIIIVSMVIVGGLASMRGSIISAILLTVLPELLRFISIPPDVLGPTRQILYGCILLTVLICHPRGMFGHIDMI